jgi:DNA-binding beta-propeller fold protein YncE
MKKIKLSYIYVLTLLVIASACKKEEETPRGEFASGVVVINEGNFGENDGSFGFFDPADNTITQDIYQQANDDTESGLFQSIFTFEDKSYLIDNGGSKIVVVEAETFKYVATITDGISSPRYMTVANGKGYISNWGEFPDPAYVAVIDLTNFVVINEINAASGVNDILTINGKVYTAAWSSNIVHEIDPTNDAITGGFETQLSPRLLEEDANGRLWVFSNYYDFTTELTTNYLSQIDLVASKISKSFEIPVDAQRLEVNGDGSSLYLGTTTGVYKIGLDANSMPLTPLFETTSLYGLGVDPSDETIYVGLSTFVGNGTVVRYNPDGTELDNFPAARNPNGFEFRN